MWTSTLRAPSFETAVDLLAKSDAIWIVGSRRSFPIAAYLEYALQHTDRRVGLISALGSMHLGQVNSTREGDVMVAISFPPFADETVKVAERLLSWSQQHVLWRTLKLQVSRTKDDERPRIGPLV